MSYQDDIRKMMGELPPEPKARADTVVSEDGLKKIQDALDNLSSMAMVDLQATQKAISNMAKAISNSCKPPYKISPYEPPNIKWDLHAPDAPYFPKPPTIEFEISKSMINKDALRKLLGEWGD